MSERKWTKGPWRWEVNPTSKSVHLVGGRPTFDKTVMQFKRWGMSNSTVMFNEAITGGEFNIMYAPHEYPGWLIPFTGREHHADWAMDLNHPDARLMAAAPCLYEALDALLPYAANMLEHDHPVVAKARAALQRAEGEL